MQARHFTYCLGGLRRPLQAYVALARSANRLLSDVPA